MCPFQSTYEESKLASDDESDGEAGEAADGGAGAGSASARAAPLVLTDEQLARRCEILKESATSVCFQYVNRGLFEVDKLTVATLMCFKILVDDHGVDPNVVVSAPPPTALCGIARPGSRPLTGPWLRLER